MYTLHDIMNGADTDISVGEFTVDILEADAHVFNCTVPTVMSVLNNTKMDYVDAPIKKDCS